MDASDPESSAREIARLEAGLRDSQERLRDLLAAMAEGVIVYDASGRAVDFNESALRILRCTAGQVLGTELPDPNWHAIDEEGSELDVELRPSRVALRTGTTQVGVVRGIATSEGTVWISINARPLLRPGSDRPEGVVCTLTDITERRAALQALRESEERYRSAVAALSEGLTVLDSNFRILACNESAARMFGRTVEEVLGESTLVSAVYGEDGEELPPVRRPSASTVLTGVPTKDAVVRVVAVNGVERWLSVNAQPLGPPGPDGRRGAVVSFSDVTERKQAEESRRQLEEQLRQAQKMEAVGTLAAGIAHDFNNILAAILGNVDLALLDLPEGHPLRERFGEIERAAVRGRDLVQRLGTFGRRREARRSHVSLSQAIDDVARLLRPVLPEPVALVTQVSEDACVVADENEIHQVLVNLCTNAVAAIGDRPGTVRMGLGRTDDDAALLWVEDDGEGMDEGTLARIFDPFFTTKAVGAGTGLGLAIVHGIVSSLGGTVTARSAPGHGSRFDVTLPLRTDAARPPEQHSPEAGALPAPEQGAEAGAGGLVMFIDDDPALVLLGRTALERGGFRVAGYEDPAEALAAFRRNPGEPCLVITDVVMPGMSGIELAAEVRRVRPDVPLVLTSAIDSLVPDEALARLAPARLALKPWSHVGIVELAKDALAN